MDHKVEGNIIFPFAGYFAIAGEALRQIANLLNGSGYRLRNVVINEALMLKDLQPVKIKTLMQPKKLTESESLRSSSSKFSHLTVQYRQSTVQATPL
jgi:hypothetical protein